MNKPVLPLPVGAPVIVEPAQEVPRGKLRYFHNEKRPKRGRPRKFDWINDTPPSWAEYKEVSRRKERAERMENVAILDMETDPFDNIKQNLVLPFLAVLYRDGAMPDIIWDENIDSFIIKVIQAIKNLPGRYTVYAHNGGRFDYMYLMYHFRGRMAFKGRGLMSARVGNHLLRDSFHIIPESLASLQKDNFDYTKLTKARRNDYRDEIIRYCVNDCAYLLKYVKAFLLRHGFRISIGQAAQSVLKKHYTVKRLSKNSDAHMRRFFFGGRVECIQGRGTWRAGARPFYLYDVNSMYPYVMAKYQHPIGNSWYSHEGPPTRDTIFIRLRCKNKRAFASRDDKGATTFACPEGEFFTTIWEYDVALKYNLVSDVEFIECIDFYDRTTFADFVLPLYAERQETKTHMEALEARGLKGSVEYFQARCANINTKLLLNNAYGKFAQDPARYGEYFYTDPEKRPPCDCRGCNLKWPFVGDRENRPWIHLAPTGKKVECRSWGYWPEFEDTEAGFWIWKRPAVVRRYNNVATAASITGAARAVLLEAIQLAIDPIYCDTDSLICRGLTGGIKIDKIELGAWDIEKRLDEIKIAGKKLYGYLVHGIANGQPGREVVKSKGVPAASWKNGKPINGLTYTQLDRVVCGGEIEITANSPTLNRYGFQTYARRIVKATAEITPRKRGSGGLRHERTARVSSQ